VNRVVVLGGSVTGLSAARSLRRRGFSGEILMIGEEGRGVAAGDVARWYNPLFGAYMRVEHWSNASAQTDAAVDALLPPATARPNAHVPYFWSEQYDTRLQFVGRRAGANGGRLAHGRPAERSFVITYETRGSGRGRPRRQPSAGTQPLPCAHRRRRRRRER
jgi:NADPH-dependent 2,4-dienoyl-CoA reductase/sulfur reductase-like enzyme